MTVTSDAMNTQEEAQKETKETMEAHHNPHNHGMAEEQFQNEMENNINSEVNTAEANQVKDMASLDLENENWKDRFLRLSAEFDNFRKRTNREKEQLILMGNERLLEMLLPIVDDLDRALEAAKSTSNLEALLVGIASVKKKFFATLEKQGVKAMDTTSTEFNSEYHEAIASIPVDDPAKKGKIVEFFAKGYMLNDKVLRYAKVITGE